MAIPPRPPVGQFDGGAVFIDGAYAPLSEGKISLFDWGFTRSDATYDVASTWNGAPLAALVARISTMPPEKPGNLAREQNVDILTYLLWYHGLPLGGEPLSSEPDVLSRVTFQLAPSQ